jgi:hypothetical protein
LAALSIDGEASTPMTWPTKGANASATWPVPHPRSATTAPSSRSPRSAGRKKAPSEQIVAELIPLRGARAEEFLGARAPRGENLGEAALVLLRRERAGGFLPDQEPQRPQRGVELCRGDRVAPVGPVGARGQPAAVTQSLQVAADGRLRRLHDAAQLADGELVALEDEEDAVAQGVAQHRHLAQERRGLRH